MKILISFITNMYTFTIADGCIEEMAINALHVTIDILIHEHKISSSDSPSMSNFPNTNRITILDPQPIIY